MVQEPRNSLPINGLVSLNQHQPEHDTHHKQQPLVERHGEPCFDVLCSVDGLIVTKGQPKPYPAVQPIDDAYCSPASEDH
jgi:hypothetical protein